MSFGLNITKSVGPHRPCLLLFHFHDSGVSFPLRKRESVEVAVWEETLWCHGNSILRTVMQNWCVLIFVWNRAWTTNFAFENRLGSLSDCFAFVVRTPTFVCLSSCCRRVAVSFARWYASCDVQVEIECCKKYCNAEEENCESHIKPLCCAFGNRVGTCRRHYTLFWNRTNRGSHLVLIQIGHPNFRQNNMFFRRWSGCLTFLRILRNENASLSFIAVVVT